MKYSIAENLSRVIASDTVIDKEGSIHLAIPDVVGDTCATCSLRAHCTCFEWVEGADIHCATKKFHFVKIEQP